MLLASVRSTIDVAPSVSTEWAIGVFLFASAISIATTIYAILWQIWDHRERRRDDQQLEELHRERDSDGAT